ncbi:MAG: glycosyltransferase [Bacteroidota bacterium]|nr:glycosyltransferase [Bacteroidota bacterium]
MEPSEPIKITIITVCKNSERFLAETIESVTGQTYRDIQYIVVDGNSTDGTIDIIKQYSSNIDTWLSEADEGMYDAINKGLKLAVGDYILILNSDDVLASNGTIKNIISNISNERPDYFYGNLVKLKEGKTKKVQLFPVTFRQLLFSTHGTFVPHPCFFISNNLNKKLEGYNLNYKYASDYDYILRTLAITGSSGKYVNINITNFRLHDNSITASGRIDAERKKILALHGYYKQPFFKRFFFYYALWIYYKIINLGNVYKVY